MIKNYYIFFILLIVLFLIGRFIPAFFISSGVENYVGDKKLVAYSALLESDLLTSKIERIWVSAKKVESIEKISDDSTCETFPFGEKVNGQYKAEIKIYTLFGLPYGKVEVECGGASIERF